MSDDELDKLLRRALLEAADAQWGPVMEEEGPPLRFTPARERTMARLLRDPFGYGRRRGQPLWRRALRTAACFLVLLALALGSLMALSPAARAWVQRVIVQQFRTNTDISYTGGDTGEVAGVWRPTWLPDGYQETKVTAVGLGWALQYENESGDILYLSYKNIDAETTFNFDNEHSVMTEIEFNGYPAYLFTSNTDGKPSCLIWLDSKGNTVFQTIGMVSPKDMLKIAKNVVQSRE